jgi:BirA family transcriptional regulator, biotin operon repressor / biotin---[acetyl-CoA-carboxylase] ligase
LLKTSFKGKEVIRLGTVVSTNLIASELVLEKQPPEGTSVLAQFQTQGRGQSGTRWESEEGKNLLVSMILYPKFMLPKDLFRLNKIIALGIYDFVKSVLKKNVFIKWPNDILAGDKKIAGILIENSVTFSEVNYAIVGVGLNVNQRKFGDYSPAATSLKLMTKKSHELEKCFEALSNCIETRYLKLKEKQYSEIDEDYRNALYCFRKFTVYKRKQATFKARIIDVMEDGKLVLEHENGKFEAFRFKEIGLVINS